MANPRQRNKARSHKNRGPSINQKRRIHQKLKKTPTLKGPEILQQSWDKKKTVFQNYAALGLLPNIPIPNRSSSRSFKARLPFLPPHLRSAYGVFDDEESEARSGPSSAGTGEPAGSSATGGKARAGFGRIVRDEEGNIVDIIIDQEPSHEVAEEDAAINGADVDEGESAVKKVEGKTAIVKSLEALAATSQPVIRHASTSERTWLQQLVDKYGDDTERMSRDRALNVWQKTEGEIRRAIKKAGGVNKLRS